MYNNDNHFIEKGRCLLKNLSKKYVGMTLRKDIFGQDGALLL